MEQCKFITYCSVSRCIILSMKKTNACCSAFVSTAIELVQTMAAGNRSGRYADSVLQCQSLPKKKFTVYFYVGAPDFSLIFLFHVEIKM